MMNNNINVKIAAHDCKANPNPIKIIRAPEYDGWRTY